MMNSIRKKIGPDLSLQHLQPVILTICKTFEGIYIGKGDMKVRIKVIFRVSKKLILILL